MVRELVARARQEAQAKGAKFNENAVQKSMEKSVVTHLKNARQTFRAEIVKHMKVIMTMTLH